MYITAFYTALFNYRCNVGYFLSHLNVEGRSICIHDSIMLNIHSYGVRDCLVDMLFGSSVLRGKEVISRSRLRHRAMDSESVKGWSKTTRSTGGS